MSTSRDLPRHHLPSEANIGDSGNGADEICTCDNGAKTGINTVVDADTTYKACQVNPPMTVAAIFPPPRPPMHTPCVVAHTYAAACPSNSVQVQVWEDGILVCASYRSILFASHRTVFDMECNEGYGFRVTSKGAECQFTSKSGYSVVLDLTDFGSMIVTCAEIDNTKKIRGRQLEHYLSNNADTCGSFNKCALCDYRAVCP